MIDFLKIQVTEMDTITEIWGNENLVFHNYNERLSHFDFETLITKSVKTWEGLLFCRFENRMDILFRPHYNFNNHLHNANDFSALDCIRTVEKFIKAFKINNCSLFKIVNIEFGLNFLLPGYGKEFISHLLYWKKTAFVNDSDLKYSKKAYNANAKGLPNTYKIVKLYSKGVQHPKFCDPNTLRLEIKSKQSRYINKLNIEHLGHFLNPDVYMLMKDELTQLTKDILILQHDTDFRNLTVREKHKLKDYLNSHVWYLQTMKSANQFWKMKQRYLELLDKTGANIHQLFSEKVCKKLEELTNEKGLNSTTLKLASIESEKGLNSTTNIIGISPPTDLSNVLCRVTGLTLEFEHPLKPNESVPKYIRTKTLRYLKENEPLRFERLRLDLLPAKKHHTPKFEKSIFSHMAKQIRNRFFNGNRDKKKGYNKPKFQHPEQLTLYEALGL